MNGSGSKSPGIGCYSRFGYIVTYSLQDGEAVFELRVFGEECLQVGVERCVDGFTLDVLL